MKRNRQSWWNHDQPIKRNPMCGRLLADVRKIGIEVQTWGFSNANECVYAGVHWVKEITPRTIWKLHNHWLRWRKWYDNLPENRRRDYPAKHNPIVAFSGMRPIDAECGANVWLKVG